MNNSFVCFRKQAVSIRAAASDQNRQNRQSIDRFSRIFKQMLNFFNTRICCFSLPLSFGLKKRFEDVCFIDVTITCDINLSLNFDSWHSLLQLFFFLYLFYISVNWIYLRFGQLVEQNRTCYRRHLGPDDQLIKDNGSIHYKADRRVDWVRNIWQIWQQTLEFWISNPSRTHQKHQ